MSAAREPDLFEAAERRDTAIQTVVDNADANSPGWSESAVLAMAEFCRQRTASFVAEEARLWCYAQGLERPHDDRAWGAVVRRAEKTGLMRRIGYAPAKSSNLSPKVLWEAQQKQQSR